jgi:hypothetical protein
VSTFRGDYKVADHSCESAGSRFCHARTAACSVLAACVHSERARPRIGDHRHGWPDDGFRRATFDDWRVDVCRITDHPSQSTREEHCTRSGSAERGKDRRVLRPARTRPRCRAASDRRGNRRARRPCHHRRPYRHRVEGVRRQAVDATRVALRRSRRDVRGKRVGGDRRGVRSTARADPRRPLLRVLEYPQPAAAVMAVQ